jgi:hypothetical protein
MIFIVEAGLKPASTRHVKHCYCWEFFKKLKCYQHYIIQE